MPQSAAPENSSAARSSAGSPAGIRAPIPKCNAPRRLQRMKWVCVSTTQWCLRAPIVPAKDKAAGTFQRSHSAESPAARQPELCCSAAPPEFPSASVAPLGPASAQSTETPQSRSDPPATPPAIGNTTTSRRRLASPRRCHAPPANSAQFFPARAERSRSPNSAATHLEFEFRIAPLHYTRRNEYLRPAEESRFRERRRANGARNLLSRRHRSRNRSFRGFSTIVVGSGSWRRSRNG